MPLPGSTWHQGQDFAAALSATQHTMIAWGGPMTTATSNPIKRIYSRLSDELGLDRPYVRQRILPDWWDDALAENPAAFAEAVGHISRHTGLLLDALLDEGFPLEFPGTHVRYYKSDRLSYQDVNLAGQLASGLAALVASAVTVPYRPIPNHYDEIRTQILAEGKPGVSFEALVAWCWKHGIPVVPMVNFPKKQRKMQGLISFRAPNPVIVLSDGHRFHSWLLFHLAHEIGHLALGHVGEDTLLMDAEISQVGSESATGYGSDGDAENEKAATEFGVGIITGEHSPIYTSSHHLTAEQVAREATRLGNESRVDPGFIALNYAWQKGFLAVGMGALKHIEGDSSAQELLRQATLANLDRERLPEETLNYIVRAMA